MNFSYRSRKFTPCFGPKYLPNTALKDSGAETVLIKILRASSSIDMPSLAARIRRRR